MFDELVRAFEEEVQEDLDPNFYLRSVVVDGALLEVLVEGAAVCSPRIPVRHESDVPFPSSSVREFPSGGPDGSDASGVRTC